MNHKNIELLSNTCQNPLKNHKATKPDAMYDGPLTVVFGSSLPSSTKKKKRFLRSVHDFRCMWLKESWQGWPQILLFECTYPLKSGIIYMLNI